MSFFWPPQKESDQQITVQVEGDLDTFTQTGLAAGQEFTVSVRGETNGRMGAESSAEFRTRKTSCPLLDNMLCSWRCHGDSVLRLLLL